MWDEDAGATLQDLLEDGHFEDAEALLDQLIELNPDAAPLHALRALLLHDRGRRDEALAAGERAVQVDPHEWFGHWVVGVLLESRQRVKEAMTYAVTARDLAPADAAPWTLIGQIRAREGKWQDALAAADRALQLDPGHEAASQLRALALRHVRSDRDWSEELTALIDRFPASEWLRASQGWAALERGSAHEARQHFEQAMALDPTSERARLGLTEAMKAQNPVYRQVLRFLLWFQRQPPKTRWMIVLGGIFGYRVLRNASEAVPALRVIAYPLMGAWVLAVLLTWIASPLADFVLSLDPASRRFLDRDQKLGGRAVAAVLGIALLAALVGAVTGVERAWTTAMVAGVLLLPVSAVFQCEEGWPRTTMLLYAAAASLTVPITAFAPTDDASWAAFGIGLLMGVAGSWIGVWLGSRRVAR